ncbi:hypothetical protein KFE94_16010 [bacterium SCSIO 12643]|nr:hypothetical protein KFE94_16010 [bacterium SCSIO 12643]
MGAEIHISLESDKYDDQELAPFLGRSFHYEITRGAIWENRAPFLSKAEIELLEAPYYDGIEYESVQLISPNDLKAVLEKVKNYLYAYRDTLPFEIDIDHERMENAGLSSYLTVNGSKCWIKGDSLYHHVSEKVQISNYPMEPTSIDVWIDYADEVVIDGNKYYLKKTSRFEKFADTLDQVIAFCEMANKKNEKIYWLYNH